MRLVFRYDFGPSIGNGHKSRCALLAHAAKQRGHEVFEATNLTTPLEPHINPLAPIDWIILDHYGYQDTDIAQLKRASNARILVLDDHLERKHADLRWAPFSTDSTEPTLRGEQYALINPCFFHTTTNHRSPDSFNLVCFGGADPKHLTQTFLSSIAQSDPNHWIVIANQHMQTEQSLHRFSSFPNIELMDHIQPSHLARLFHQANTTLVSASTLALEALAAKANVIALAYTKNQKNIAHWLTKKKIPVFYDITQLTKAAFETSHEPAPTLLDDQGANRVFMAIEALKSNLNPKLH